MVFSATRRANQANATLWFLTGYAHVSHRLVSALSAWNIDSFNSHFLGEVKAVTMSKIRGLMKNWYVYSKLALTLFESGQWTAVHLALRWVVCGFYEQVSCSKWCSFCKRCSWNRYSWRKYWYSSYRYSVEVVPIYVITGLAVGGASWYLSRLARGPDVVWDHKVSNAIVKT